MKLQLDFHNNSDDITVPNATQFKLWVIHVLQNKMPEAEVSIRLVNKKESAQLNETFRAKKGPTNILSFPANLPHDVAKSYPLLGDLVICSALVYEEALAQNKPTIAHWAHLTIHGMLHLLGYDHEIEEEAKIMETLEIKLLGDLGYPDPYGEN
jgi:probable rRNA maturation factor